MDDFAPKDGNLLDTVGRLADKLVKICAPKEKRSGVRIAAATVSKIFLPFPLASDLDLGLLHGSDTLERAPSIP